MVLPCSVVCLFERLFMRPSSMWWPCGTLQVSKAQFTSELMARRSSLAAGDLTVPWGLLVGFLDDLGCSCFFELFSSHMTLETWALLQLLGENRRDGTLPLPVADCSSRWQLGALPVLTIATRRSWRSWRNWAKMIQDDPQLPQILWFLFEVTHDSEHSWLSTSLNPPVWRFLLMWKRRPVEGVFGLPRCLFCWESKQNQKFGMSDAASQLCHFPFTKLLNIKYSFFLSGITLKIWKARCVGETTPYAHKHILQQVET